MSDRKAHPSGRPIRRPERRDYSMAAHRRIGFVCPRLNESRVDTHAVGFIDWQARHAADDLDMKGRKP